MIYLCGPIDFEPKSEGARGWRYQAKKWLNEPCFDPAAAFGPVGLNNAGIGRINDLVLRECDGVLAVINIHERTVGSWMEIERAAELGKPVVVFLEKEAMEPVPPMLVEKQGVEVLYDFSQAMVEMRKRAAEYRLSKQHNIKVVLEENGQTPEKFYQGDVGYDLYTSEPLTVEPQEFKDVACGADAVELPFGYWGLIQGRSSTWRRYRLMVIAGVIDQGYRGPLWVGVWNAGQEFVRIEKETRLAQLILIKASPDFGVEAVGRVSKSERGKSGFGSTDLTPS